jgi:hypothetical protein
MARRKTTTYLEEDVARAARVMAARTGQKEYEIINEALRGYLGLAAVEKVWARNRLSTDEASTLAYSELTQMRREQAVNPSSV